MTKKATTKKAAEKSTAVATQSDEEKALAALYEGDAESGFEDTDRDDYAIPFLKLLQKGSPEVDEDSGSAIDGAKAGMFYDSATGDLLDEVDVVPCHYKRAMVEWKDRDEGGGWVGQHEPGAEEGLERDKSGRFVLDNGNYLADTRYFFCLRIAENGSLLPVVMSFTSTQIKKAKGWMTRMQSLKAVGARGQYTLPMFSHVYRLSSVAESNDQGTWRGYRIDLVGPVRDAEIAKAAKDAREMFKEKGDDVKPPEEGAPPSGGGSSDKGDDIPF